MTQFFEVNPPTATSSTFPVFIIGNKADLEEKRQVDR